MKLFLNHIELQIQQHLKENANLAFRASNQPTAAHDC